MAQPTDQYLDWLFSDPRAALKDIQFLYADSREDIERSTDDYDSADYDSMSSD